MLVSRVTAEGFVPTSLVTESIPFPTEGCIFVNITDSEHYIGDDPKRKNSDANDCFGQLSKVKAKP